MRPDLLRIGDVIETYVPNKGYFWRTVIAIDDLTDKAIFSDGCLGDRFFLTWFDAEYYEWKLRYRLDLNHPTNCSNCGKHLTQYVSRIRGMCSKCYRNIKDIR